MYSRMLACGATLCLHAHIKLSTLLQFPNIDYAPNIRCPVFIVHGTQDEVVPFWHGENLFSALPQEWRAKPFWVDGAGHNNIEALLRPTGAFVDKLNEFLDLHISARRGRIVAPTRVPECVPLALREIGSVSGRGSQDSLV